MRITNAAGFAIERMLRRHSGTLHARVLAINAKSDIAAFTYLIFYYANY